MVRPLRSEQFASDEVAMVHCEHNVCRFESSSRQRPNRPTARCIPWHSPPPRGEVASNASRWGYERFKSKDRERTMTEANETGIVAMGIAAK